jgi:hypothetical protein
MTSRYVHDNSRSSKREVKPDSSTKDEGGNGYNYTRAASGRKHGHRQWEFFEAPIKGRVRGTWILTLQDSRLQSGAGYHPGGA